MVFAVLIFYVLTIAGMFVLRRKRPDAERPYRAFGYPLVPALYILAATAITLVLLVYRTSTSLAGPAHRADRHSCLSRSGASWVPRARSGGRDEGLTLIIALEV